MYLDTISDIRRYFALASFEDVPNLNNIELAGRVIFYRNNGKICFGKIQDSSGRLQFVLKKDSNEALFSEWSKNIKIGDIVRLKGAVWKSSTGELSILVDQEIELYCRSTHPFPDKWKGIVDPETRLRKRYLDIILDEDYRRVFQFRSKMISVLRSTLTAHNFVEIETPIMAAQASGAQARPFVTHHNSLDADLYLRIAPETYLKRATVAGFDRVFEIGKNFRNEGMDPSHLQEFTSIEWYACYWNYKDNLHFFRRDILPFVLENSPSYNSKNMVLEYQDELLAFEDALVRDYDEVFHEHTGKYPSEVGSAADIDELFKKKVRPNLIQPVYLIDYPAHMSPLAKRKDDDPDHVEQWQLIVNGWELVKCYTELTDPALQRKLLLEQMQQRADGDEEAMMIEEDFLECMEYGMPPQSGLGMGIDRMVALLTNQTSLRDVVMFPTLL